MRTLVPGIGSITDISAVRAKVFADQRYDVG